MALYFNRGHNLSPFFRSDFSLFNDWLNDDDLFSLSTLVPRNEGKEIAINGQEKEKKQKETGVISFPLGGCKPENVQIDVKDGILHVECKEEGKHGFRHIRYERTLPKEVDLNTLKANLQPNGVLQIKMESPSTAIPITQGENAKE